MYLSGINPPHGRRRTYASAADDAEWKAKSTSFEAMGALSFGTVQMR